MSSKVLQGVGEMKRRRVSDLPAPINEANRMLIYSKISLIKNNSYMHVN